MGQNENIDFESGIDMEEHQMRIAIPVSGGKLAEHFGHCEQFALIDVDKMKKEVLTKVLVDAPPHQPGLLPKWLADQGANVVIAGGMGRKARELFEQNSIAVVIGASERSPELIVSCYLHDSLNTGENICGH
jgi:predicted Fe-Mo cluster-binding NifX family protein